MTPRSQIKSIILATAKVFDVPAESILTKRLAPPILQARRVAIYVASKMVEHESATELGRMLGVDRKTVAKSVEWVDERMDYGGRMWGVVETVKDLVR